MQKYKIPIPLPSAGINYQDASLIGDNEAAEGTVNISFKNGTPQTRAGYVMQKKFDTFFELNSITKLFPYTVGGEEKLAYSTWSDTVSADRKLYALDEDTVGAKKLVGLVETKHPSMIAFNGGFLGGTYSEKVLVLTGTGFKYFDETTNLTNVPVYPPTSEDIANIGTNVLSTHPNEIMKQKWIINDDNRLWLAGYGNLVRFSHIDDAGAMPTYFPSTYAIKLPEDCTGMARYMGEVLLFTRNTATLVTGSTPVMSIDDSYKLTLLQGNYGCVQAETIAMGDNALYWANESGIFRYSYMPSGYSIPECVSEFVVNDEFGRRTRTVKKKLDEITDWTKVFAVFHDHEYRLYLGNGEVLCFNAVMNSWSFYKYYHEFSSGAVFSNTLYYGSARTEFLSASIYHMDYPFDPYNVSYTTSDTGDLIATYEGLSDNGRAFSSTLKSKFFDFGKSSEKKRFERFYFTIFSELITYNLLLKVNMDNEVQTLSGAIEPNKVSRWGNDDPEDDLLESQYALAFGDVVNAERTNLNYPVKLVHKGKRYNIQYELTTIGLNEAWLLKDVVLMLKVKELQ